MTYDRFEQLPVWQAAIELGERVYAVTEKPVFRPRFSLRDQIERATVSISNNIAEGFERGNHTRTADVSLYRPGFSRRSSFDVVLDRAVPCLC